MENKKQKDILKSIVEMNGIIDSFIGESRKETEEKYKDYDTDQLGDAIAQKAKSITSDLKGRLSAFKHIDVEEPETTKSSNTSTLFKDVGINNEFIMTFNSVQPIQNGSGSSTVISFQGVGQKFKAISYGGKNGDFIKGKGNGGPGDREYFLISFSRKAVKNDNVEGKISWCKGEKCNVKGASTEYTAKIHW